MRETFVLNLCVLHSSLTDVLERKRSLVSPYRHSESPTYRYTVFIALIAMQFI